MRRLWTPAWIARHVLTVVLVVGFLALGWWQIRRAASGNALSWAYAFEWPVFAGFVVFLWFREARHAVTVSTAGGEDDRASTDPPRAAGIRHPVRFTTPAGSVAVANDPELADYNRYLAWLNANPGARPGDYPG